MGSFRGDDSTLDREIATLEAMARVRVKRATRELNDLERELRELRAERARRRVRAEVPATGGTTAASA